MNTLSISGIYLSNYSTTCLVISVYYNINAWQYEIYRDTQNATEKEDSLLAKRVNKHLELSVNSTNADGPVNSTVDNKKLLNKTNSVERRLEYDASPLVFTHRLQNLKKLKIGHLNVNSLGNKIEAVKEFETSIDICLLLETKIDETFPNQLLNISNYKRFCRDRH